MGSISPTQGGASGPNHMDADALAAKYASERAKRLSTGEGRSQSNAPVNGEVLSQLKKDTGATFSTRDAITGNVRVVIVGGGIAGIVAAVKLKERGIDEFVIIEKGSRCGGTWYWNQYPGLACDIEALIYLPFLEETGYVPKSRFPSGLEIRAHIDRIVDKWELSSKTVLQTSASTIRWDEPARRWLIESDRSDHWTAQFVVLATGLFHDPKLPQIPGLDDFKGDHFHSSRWDYQVTGGSACSPMDRLADKTVGIIGTGASAVQIVPQVARDAKKLYVFQRTPSSITLRDNTPIDAATIASWPRGWQRARMQDFASIVQGEELSDKLCSATEGFDALALRNILRDYSSCNDCKQPTALSEIQHQLPRLFQEADWRLMDRLRATVEASVHDRATAERLKPWYSFFCKRPAFHNQYLDTFNQPHVELVDTQGQGVSHLTSTGVVVADGREHGVDVLIYCTGFDFEIGTGFYDRTGIHLVGAAGQTLHDAWAAEGPSTLFGIHVRGFPNLFYMGPVQAGATFNYTHTVCESAEHIAAMVRHCVDHDHEFQAVEPTQEAQADWVRQNEDGADQRLEYAQSCTPGYFNGQGQPDKIPARWGYYPKGVRAWVQSMQASREGGKLAGFETR